MASELGASNSLDSDTYLRIGAINSLKPVTISKFGAAFFYSNAGL